jgi:hypothetical protein
VADLFVRTVTWTILINPLRALINLDSTEPHDGVTLAPILDNIHAFATSLDANPGAFVAAIKADPAVPAELTWRQSAQLMEWTANQDRRRAVTLAGATTGLSVAALVRADLSAFTSDARFDELYLDSVLKNVKALGRALCVSMERNMPELLTHTGGKYSIDKQEDWMKVHADRRLGVNDPSECCFAIVKAIKEKYAGGKEENLAGVALAQANGTFNRPRSPAKTAKGRARDEAIGPKLDGAFHFASAAQQEVHLASSRELGPAQREAEQARRDARAEHERGAVAKKLEKARAKVKEAAATAAFFHNLERVTTKAAITAKLAAAKNQKPKLQFLDHQIKHRTLGCRLAAEDYGFDISLRTDLNGKERIAALTAQLEKMVSAERGNAKLAKPEKPAVAAGGGGPQARPSLGPSTAQRDRHVQESEARAADLIEFEDDEELLALDDFIGKRFWDAEERGLSRSRIVDDIVELRDGEFAAQTSCVDLVTGVLPEGSHRNEADYNLQGNWADGTPAVTGFQAMVDAYEPARQAQMAKDLKKQQRAAQRGEKASGGASAAASAAPAPAPARRSRR